MVGEVVAQRRNIIKGLQFQTAHKAASTRKGFFPLVPNSARSSADATVVPLKRGA
jgi:hypothetical protein